MKKTNRVSFFIAWAMSAAVGFSGAACIATGFKMEQVGLLGILTMIVLLTGLSGAALFYLRRGRRYVLSIVAVLTGLCWNGILNGSLEKMVFTVTNLFHIGYGWPVFRWTERDLSRIGAGAGLVFVGFVAALVMLLTLRYRKGGLAAVITALLPLGVCMVLTNTVPDKWCIALLMLSLLLFMLTNMVRRRSEADGNRLTAGLLIPCILLTALLFTVTPQKPPEIGVQMNYQQVLGSLQDSPFVQLGNDGMLHLSFEKLNENVLDLKTVGPRERNSFSVMNVVSTAGGSLYLRGQSFDKYDGTRWIVSNPYEMEYNSKTDSCSWPTEGTQYYGEVTVSVISKSALFYTPYILNRNCLKKMEGGRFPNKEDIRTYSFDSYGFLYGEDYGCVLPEEARLRYTQIPEGSKEALERALASAMVYSIWFLDELETFVTPQGAERYMAAIVGSYVQSLAKYDLNSQRMPDSEKDFVCWFLENGKTGYCVHFASAATMLLRMAGIPARMVTGYMVSVREKQVTPVAASMAHAWVEYFTEECGWQILDPTPASGSGDDVQGWIPENPEDETIPMLTHPARPGVDEPTRPTQSETESTRPQMPTTPQEPTQHPTQQTEKPSPGGTTEGSSIPGWIPGLMILLLLIAQAELRKTMRQRRWCHGEANQRARAMWHECAYRCRIMNIKPDPAIFSLAEKAMFSRFGVNDEELKQIKQYLDKTGCWIRFSPFGRRLLYWLIFAVR